MMTLLMILLAGCGGRNFQAETGELLLEEDFSTGYGWEENASGGVEIGVQNGVYRMRTDVNQYVRGFGTARHADAIIDVEALQRTPDENNAFGIICRGGLSADTGSGYYFLIGANGSYAILKGTNGDPQPLVDWARSGAVREGAGTNLIRAVCVGDRLALYVNDELVAQTTDTSYQSGYTGFVVAAGRGTVAEIAFDNLRVWEAHLPE
ncbi:MAG: hypothetical protein SF029_20370 [bacterium]|nr:hypothetical protein [bacterium]